MESVNNRSQDSLNNPGKLTDTKELHEARVSLEWKLQSRSKPDELLSKGILYGTSTFESPDSIRQKRQLELAKTSDVISKKLKERPTRGSLEGKNILKAGSSYTSPVLHASQASLQRQKTADILNNRLLVRPGPVDLICKGILPVPGTKNSSLPQSDNYEYDVNGAWQTEDEVICVSLSKNLNPSFSIGENIPNSSQIHRLKKSESNEYSPILSTNSPKIRNKRQHKNSKVKQFKYHEYTPSMFNRDIPVAKSGNNNNPITLNGFSSLNNNITTPTTTSSNSNISENSNTSFNGDNISNNNNSNNSNNNDSEKIDDIKAQNRKSNFDNNLQQQQLLLQLQLMEQLEPSLIKEITPQVLQNYLEIDVTSEEVTKTSKRFTCHYLQDKNVQQLRLLCKTYSLPTSGKKAQLIEKLLNVDDVSSNEKEDISLESTEIDKNIPNSNSPREFNPQNSNHTIFGSNTSLLSEKSSIITISDSERSDSTKSRHKSDFSGQNEYLDNSQSPFSRLRNISQFVDVTSSSLDDLHIDNNNINSINSDSRIIPNLLHYNSTSSTLEDTPSEYFHNDQISQFLTPLCPIKIASLKSKSLTDFDSNRNLNLHSTKKFSFAAPSYPSNDLQTYEHLKTSNSNEILHNQQFVARNFDLDLSVLEPSINPEEFLHYNYPPISNSHPSSFQNNLEASNFAHRQIETQTEFQHFQNLPLLPDPEHGFQESLHSQHPHIHTNNLSRNLTLPYIEMDTTNTENQIYSSTHQEFPNLHHDQNSIGEFNNTDYFSMHHLPCQSNYYDVTHNYNDTSLDSLLNGSIEGWNNGEFYNHTNNGSHWVDHTRTYY